jgi:hypothetical protein
MILFPVNEEKELSIAEISFNTQNIYSLSVSTQSQPCSQICRRQGTMCGYELTTARTLPGKLVGVGRQ